MKCIILTQATLNRLLELTMYRLNTGMIPSQHIRFSSMSELLDAETEQALQQVLAFLSDCEPQEHSYSQAPISQTHEIEAAENPSSTLSDQRKRSMRLATKSRYRSRVKEEYSRLQSDVRALEATLAQLQWTSGSAQLASESGQDPQSLTEASTTKSIAPPSMREVATRECKRRKQSETVNRELKDLLGSFERASSATKAAWDKVLSKKVGTFVSVGATQRLNLLMPSHQNLAMLHGPRQQPTCDMRAQRLRIAGFPNSMDSLFARIDRLALDTDWHFDRSGLNCFSSFDFRMQRAADPAFDSAFEIVMSSSLPCSKEHAALQILGLFDRGDNSVSRQVSLGVLLLAPPLLSVA